MGLGGRDVKLYHYTCADAAPLIERDGYLRAYPQPILTGLPIVWLTDMETPDRSALGLTSHSLGCDRTAHRVVVDATAYHWPKFARALPMWVRRQLEFAPGAMPMHWWVSDPGAQVPILSIAPTAAAVPR
jgi:hypothetical protein